MTDCVLKSIKPWPGEPNEPKIIVDFNCSNCGLKVEGAISYYCPRDDCPCFPRVTSP